MCPSCEPTEHRVEEPARCVCGHDARAHEHYRRGTDCGECGPATCPRLELNLTPLQRLRALILG